MAGYPACHSVLVDCTLDTKSGVAVGPYLLEIPIDLKTGPLIILEIRAEVIIPSLQLSQDRLDFGTVRVGQTHVITVQLYNPKALPCEWHGIMKEGKGRPARNLFKCLPDAGVLQSGEKTNVQVPSSPVLCAGPRPVALPLPPPSQPVPLPRPKPCASGPASVPPAPCLSMAVTKQIRCRRTINARASASNASEGKGPRRRPQKRLGRRLEEVAKAVWGAVTVGYKCHSKWHSPSGDRDRLGALEGWVGYPPPLPMPPWPRPPPHLCLGPPIPVPPLAPRPSGELHPAGGGPDPPAAADQDEPEPAARHHPLQGRGGGRAAGRRAPRHHPGPRPALQQLRRPVPGTAREGKEGT